MADRWDSALYDARHSFVWERGADLVDLLYPKPGERILDLGCGTGHLTAKIAATGAEVTGLDSSPSMIALARQNYPKLKFALGDARRLQFEKEFDAVFSNAALHWIPEADSAAAGMAKALKSGGRLVLEMGAKGNIAHIVGALEEVWQEAGYTLHNPWYFPSAGEYASVLERHGFEVSLAATHERWTRLEHPEKGMREWLEMFAGPCFEGVPPAAREGLTRAVESRLRENLFRDGAWWADYRRLRVVARAA